MKGTYKKAGEAIRLLVGTIGRYQMKQVSGSNENQ
jgi:hypothetical protein